MYLREIFITNNGPIADFGHEIQLNTTTGVPKPIVLVGANGAGKTNLLSIIVDSLYESVASSFTDVLPTSGMSRAWYRLIGPITRSQGAVSGLSVLRYEHEGTSYYFREKTGTLPADYLEQIPDDLKAACTTFDSAESTKDFSIPDEVIRSVVSESSWTFFPSSRSEIPHWLNRDAVKLDLNLEGSFQNRLDRPIQVERGLRELQQWLLALVTDVRADFIDLPAPTGRVSIAVGDLDDNRVAKASWEALTAVLRNILDDPGARLVYGNRRSYLKLGFALSSGVTLPLEALSSGQATLLNMFGTLMRYGEKTSNGSLPANIAGICVVDEIDAHIHIDLQHRALPALLKMFPRVQFILSSHSPMFVLGLEREFAEDAVVLEMPSGNPISAEGYSEFEKALQIVHYTSAFNRLLVADTADSATSKLLVLVEGETDPAYLQTAAQALGRPDILDRVDIECIGDKDESGQALNTGKDALNSALRLFKSKPALVKRPVLLLYDNDVRKQAADLDTNLYVRSMPTNAGNRIVQSGIENLLPEALFTDAIFETKVSRKPNGDQTSVRRLSKTRLCESICDEPDPAHFTAFAEAIDIIEAVADLSGSAHMAAAWPNGGA